MLSLSRFAGQLARYPVGLSIPLARRHRRFVGQTKHCIGHPTLETLVIHELLEKFRIVVHHLYNHVPYRPVLTITRVAGGQTQPGIPRDLL